MKYILKWLLLSLAFVPLLFDPNTLFPSVFTKTLVIRTAITLFWVIFAIFFFTRKEEAKKALDQNWRFVKNPLYIATTVFILLVLLSTIFAVNPSKAFFGDIGRGEGLLGILHFFSFFVASLLIFKEKDWTTFFKLNLITGAILLADSFGEVLTGEFERARSLVGNPAFLAGYFLFVILSAFLVFSSSKKKTVWRILSFIMIFGGIVGVLLTGTRGAILGFIIGVLLSVIYFAVKGRDISIKLPWWKGANMQKIGLTLILFGVLGAGGFIVTKDSAIWQKIPGISRFTELSLDDPTLQTRLISASVSINSIKPEENGIHRTLIGYGPDNFNIAYNKHFNPEYMRYERRWFDRAHNKVFDVLVMNGVFGFLAYAAMWFFLFRLVFKKITEKEYAVPLLLFGSAYLIQNLFVFDQVSTYIPFFAFLAFAVFVGSGEPDEVIEKKWILKLKSFSEKILPYKIPAVAIGFSFALVMYTYIPYIHSTRFVRALRTGDIQAISSSIDSFTRPYTYAQPTIRNQLTAFAVPFIGDPSAATFTNNVISLHEEFVSREPYDPRDITLLGEAYRIKGDFGEPGAYEKAEEYYKLSLELSPMRQDHFFHLGMLAFNRGDSIKMQEYAGAMLATSPTVARTKILYVILISREGESRYEEGVEILNSAMVDPGIYFGGEQEKSTLRHIYSLYISYFYETKDTEHLLASLEGARDLEIELDKVNKKSFSAGEIDAVPPERYSRFQNSIDVFTARGWDAIRLK